MMDDDNHRSQSHISSTAHPSDAVSRQYYHGRWSALRAPLASHHSTPSISHRTHWVRAHQLRMLCRSDPSVKDIVGIAHEVVLRRITGYDFDRVCCIQLQRRQHRTLSHPCHEGDSDTDDDDDKAAFCGVRILAKRAVKGVFFIVERHLNHPNNQAQTRYQILLNSCTGTYNFSHDLVRDVAHRIELLCNKLVCDDAEGRKLVFSFANRNDAATNHRLLCFLLRDHPVNTPPSPFVSANDTSSSVGSPSVSPLCSPKSEPPPSPLLGNNYYNILANYTDDIDA